MILTEDLRQNDLKYLINNTISIDQYTSKLDDDNITVVLFCKEYEAGNDLLNFLEKIYFIEIRDIELSDTPDNDEYLLFIEFERNKVFAQTLIDMVDSISNLNDEEEWFFNSFETKKSIPLNSKNLLKHIRLTKIRDDKYEGNTTQEIVVTDESYSKTFNILGSITTDKFNQMINESDEIIKSNYDILLLEKHLLGYELIANDKYVFAIKNNEILVLE